MSDKAEKILSLDAVSLIKRDFLDEIVEERNLITEEYKEAIENKAEELLNDFKNSSAEDKKTILDQLSKLGQEDEKLKEIVDSLKLALQAIDNKVNGLDQPESVLSDNDVKKIITASLINESFWTDNSMGAPTIVGKEIVGLIGTFGKIKTENLEGTLIEGKTVQTIPDSEGNVAWQLNNTGDGHLANGNISWNENGDVTFGEGVKIKWDNVDEKPDIPEEGLTESEKEEIITTVIDRSGISAETITGKTIQSSESISEEDTDPTWQITNTGTGYLAKKNIIWDETGKLIANIDEGSLGKQNENGKYPFEWDEDNVYIHKNFVFDEGVGITWDNISGTENIASKDDIPDLDNYATKEYVDQNSGGFTTEIGNNWIKTADVTCENLKVTKVDTAPINDGDKITIMGNSIQILNDNDECGASISNNNVNFNYSREQLDTTAVFEMTDGFISLGKIVMNPSYGGEPSVGYNGTDGETGAVCAIGALGYASSLTIQCAVRILNNASFLNTSYYSFETTNTPARPYIAIYKYNDSTSNYEYKGKISCTSWDKVTSINGQPTTGTSTMYRFAISNYTFKFERGIYSLGLVIPASGIQFTTAITNCQVRVDFNVFNIQRNLPSFVDIGKNGIVINSPNGNIFMNDSQITMSMGNKKSFYGIKITSNGMYYCNGDSLWTSWNPSN